LRLLSVLHPETRAAWRNESLLLQTPLTREQMEQFFLHDYQPTPVMAPWNGGSGFYKKDNKEALEIILASNQPRLDLYRNCLRMVEEALIGVDRSASPKGDEKAILLIRMRGLLPDEAIAWLDAAVLLAGDTPQYPPLLGTGGNDGRLDFTNNFMQRLVEVLCLDGNNAETESHDWLRLALFGDTAPGLTKKAIGQFSPGQAGGPNGTTGFDADAAINPWDFVLMIEGALLFAAAAVRRNADDPYGVLSYPFTVRTVGAGSGSLGEGDAANARGELWMPLWNQPASYVEVRALLSEGRVALGGKPARDALDFVRAIHHLGGYRGIRSFQRYGLLMRSGKAYLATPLERIEVTDKPRANQLDELDQGWLEKFRKFAQGETAANRFQALRHRLENAFFDSSGKDLSCEETQAVLALLGEIQSALAGSSKAREAVDPLPRLSEQWVQHANDHTPAFRIARALAGLRGDDTFPLPLRAQLFPVHPRYPHKWIDDANNNGNDPASRVRICTGTAGSLPRMLRVLLDRRLWLAEKSDMKDKPLQSPAGATLEDIAAFLQSGSMDQRIAAFLPGLSLCDVPREDDRSSGDGSTPAAFALLKLCFTPDSILHSAKINVLAQDKRLPVPSGILAQLASEYMPERAVLSAWRRLHASGLNPVFSRNDLPSLDGIDPERAAAALLIPLRFGAYGSLARSVLKKTSEEAGSPAA
jgi:CRISPR-associated protein Csx17